MINAAGTRIDAFFLMHSARADSWRLVHAAAQGWHAGNASRADVKAALADVALLEEFHAFPGSRVMRLLDQRLDADDAARAAAMVRQISDAILASRDNADTLAQGMAGAGDELPDILPSGMGQGDHRRPSFETLFVTLQPPSRWGCSPAPACPARRRPR